ncbi:TrmB family transcriptional regulator [Acidilobus sp.]|uniref:TrmB family transcriptional regulator n=1 Tax=Acidilobus sp. TaxID=1872109 RepID=UPI003D065CAC
MSSEDNIIEALRRALDLTLYEAKLYVALLQGAKDPKEASAISGVPLPRIYDVIRVLESKGMVYRDPSGWYKAISPQSLAAMSIIRIEEEMRRRVKDVESAVKMLERFDKRLSSPSATVVRGLLNVISAAVDYFRTSSVVYVTAAYVLANGDYLGKLVSSLAAYVSDVRVLASFTPQLPQSPGVKLKSNVASLYVDSVASKSSLMVIVKDPANDEPMSLLVNDPVQANTSFKALSTLWQVAQ